MKITRTVIEENHYLVELDVGESITFKAFNKLLTVKNDATAMRLLFIPEYAVDPILSLSLRDLYAMPREHVEYVHVIIPVNLLEDVRKRLDGLPIPLPVWEKEKKEEEVKERE